MRSSNQSLKVYLLRFLRKLKILKRIDLPLKLELNNTQFHIPILKEIGFNNHCMDEYWMLDLFNEFIIKDDDILIDIGANVGQTMLKWKSVNRISPYIGIEPLPICADYLNEIIDRNSFIDSQILQNAIYDKEGPQTLHMYYSDPTDRTASLIKSQSPLQTIDIETISFDRMLDTTSKDPSKVRCIKIDVEGSELEVLRSMETFLNTFHPIIIVEILSNKSGNDEERIEAITSVILNHGYTINRVIKNGLNLERLEEVKYIDQDMRVEDSDYVLLYNLK